MNLNVDFKKLNSDYMELTTLPAGGYVVRKYGYDEELYNRCGEMVLYFCLADYDEFLQRGNSYVTVDKIDRIPYKINVTSDEDMRWKFVDVCEESTGYVFNEECFENLLYFDDVYFGVIFQEVEYIDDDGTNKTKLILVDIASTKDIRSGNYRKYPTIKYANVEEENK